MVYALFMFPRGLFALFGLFRFPSRLFRLFRFMGRVKVLGFVVNC